MDVVLVIVTVAALLLAAVMSLVAWRVTQAERERSAARVAALAAEIDAPLDAASARPEAVADSIVGAGGMFSTTRAGGAASTRLVPAVLVGVLIVGTLIGTVVVFSGGDTSASAAASEPRPLELLSLRHARQEGSLSVTGLVRNPAASRELTRVVAVVFFFDEKGSFLASGRAPLDFTSLSPGEESPFVVSLTAPPGVARYRVSFRLAEGGVVPHVDRRQARVP